MEQFNSKVLLFGEYAVLQNGMALVIPCDRYKGRLDFYETADNKKFAVQSNKFLKKFYEFVEKHMDEDFILEVKQFEKELNEGLFFSSNIPQGYGVGSSGALVAAIFLRYLKKAKNLKDDLKFLTLQKLNQLKDGLGRLESYFHGVSSGLDPLSIILNEPILYKNPRDIITTKLPPRQFNNKNNVIFLLNTKFARSTSTMMDKFNDLHSQAAFREKFSQHVIHNNNEAINHLLQNQPSKLYQSLYHLSSFQLNEMEDFFPIPLQNKVAEGLEHGDYFLKLCGAGGGGFMLGFTQKWEKTKDQLKDYNLEVIYAY